MKFLKNIHYQLKKRPDTEHQQAILRLLIITTALITISYRYGDPELTLNTVPGKAWLLVLWSIIFSILSFAHIIYDSNSNTVRRILGIVHDTSAATLFLYLNGEFASLYLFAFSFITIGNGFRFGIKYLIFAALLSAAGLAFVFSFNDYWLQHSYITWSMALNFFVVTLYTGYLLNQLQNATDELKKMATHDQLTGLSNRQVFQEFLDHAILMNARLDRTFACLYFDLDGFKKVNDELGHHYGDLLLKAVVEKVKTCIRASDLFARLGGDEFSIILDPLHSRSDSEIVAQRIINGVESIQEIQGKKLNVSVSIGCVVISPLPQNEIVSHPDVVTQADENMYKSKRAGKGTYTITDFKRSA